MIDDLRHYRAPNPEPRALALFLVLAIAVLAFVGPTDYADEILVEAEAKTARVERVLLENSAVPATLDECARANPGRERARYSVSFQDRANEPWHHRSCAFEVRS